MAKACETLEDSILGCDENRGGIKQNWIWDKDDIVDFVKDDTTHRWTKLDIGSAPKTIELVNDSAQYTDELTTEKVNQAIEWTQTLNIQKNVRNAKNSRYFRLLTQGLRYLYILILDNNGQYMIMEMAQLTEVNDGSGQVRTDGSKYLAVFEATNNHSMMFVDEDDALSLISTGQFDSSLS